MSRRPGQADWSVYRIQVNIRQTRRRVSQAMQEPGTRQQVPEGENNLFTDPLPKADIPTGLWRKGCIPSAPPTRRRYLAVRWQRSQPWLTMPVVKTPMGYWCRSTPVRDPLLDHFCLLGVIFRPFDFVLSSERSRSDNQILAFQGFKFAMHRRLYPSEPGVIP